MALQHRFTATIDHGSWWLGSRVDAQDRARRALTPEHIWLAPTLGVFGGLHHVSARLLRGLSHALLVSPLLVLAYWLVQDASPLLAGAVVVVFVSLVVAFFAVLNAFIVLAMIRYARAKHLTLRLWSLELGAAEAARRALFPGGATEKSGQVISIGAPADGSVVVRELVSRARSVRILEACDFALRTDDDEYVIVRLEDAALLLAPREAGDRSVLPEGTRASLAARGIADPTRERSLHAHVVRIGDRVRVVGHEGVPIPRVDRFELGGALRGIKSSDMPHDPYRGGRGDAATLLTCSATEPMLIVREGGA